MATIPAEKHVSNENDLGVRWEETPEGPVLSYKHRGRLSGCGGALAALVFGPLLMCVGLMGGMSQPLVPIWLRVLTFLGGVGLLYVWVAGLVDRLYIHMGKERLSGWCGPLPLGNRYSYEVESVTGLRIVDGQSQQIDSGRNHEVKPKPSWKLVVMVREGETEGEMEGEAVGEVDRVLVEYIDDEKRARFLARAIAGRYGLPSRTFEEPEIHSRPLEESRAREVTSGKLNLDTFRSPAWLRFERRGSGIYMVFRQPWWHAVGIGIAAMLFGGFFVFAAYQLTIRKAWSPMFWMFSPCLLFEALLIFSIPAAIWGRTAIEANVHEVTVKTGLIHSLGGVNVETGSILRVYVKVHEKLKDSIGPNPQRRMAPQGAQLLAETKDRGDVVLVAGGVSEKDLRLLGVLIATACRLKE